MATMVPRNRVTNYVPQAGVIRLKMSIQRSQAEADCNIPVLISVVWFG